MDSLLAIKGRGLLVINKRLPVIILISAGFWCIFELINIRIGNWYYISLPQETFRRYVGGYLLAYGTVLPGIMVTKVYLQHLIGEIKTAQFHIKGYPYYSIALGLVFLLLLYLFPLYCYALAWISFALIIDGYNYLKGYDSIMRDLEEGRTGGLVATMVSGLVCGMLWEFWNHWSITKWVYTVPFFEDLKIFEMPVLGYAGFVIFAIEVVTFVNLIRGLVKDKQQQLYLVAGLSVIVCCLSFPMIDRYIVFSYASKVEELFFIDKDRRDRLILKGVKTSYGIDVKGLNEKERATMALLHLKGLGITHLLRLNGHGIETIDDLARLDEKTLANIIDEENPRRIRVYLKAARDYVKKTKGHLD